jgi:hypothetical protein
MFFFQVRATGIIITLEGWAEKLLGGGGGGGGGGGRGGGVMAIVYSVP